MILMSQIPLEMLRVDLLGEGGLSFVGEPQADAGQPLGATLAREFLHGEGVGLQALKVPPTLKVLSGWGQTILKMDTNVLATRSCEMGHPLFNFPMVGERTWLSGYDHLYCL